MLVHNRGSRVKGHKQSEIIIYLCPEDQHQGWRRSRQSVAKRRYGMITTEKNAKATSRVAAGVNLWSASAGVRFAD